MTRVGILGSGTWGTALANMLALHNHEVTLYSSFKEETESLIPAPLKKQWKIKMWWSWLYHPFMCAKQPL